MAPGSLVASGIDYVRRWSYKARKVRRNEHTQSPEPPSP